MIETIPAFEPPTGLVDPSGRFVASEPQVVGLDVYEALGGEDAIGAISTIQELRRRRERAATLVIALGGLTLGLMQEIALFNAEVHQNRELTESDKRTIADAEAKRWRRKQRHLKRNGKI